MRKMEKKNDVPASAGQNGNTNRKYIPGSRSDPRRQIMALIDLKRMNSFREDAFIAFLRTKGRMNLKALIRPSDFTGYYRDFLKTITLDFIIQELEIPTDHIERFRTFLEEIGIEDADVGELKRKELEKFVTRFNHEYFELSIQSEE